MMTQSMDPTKLAGRLDNGIDLMTASLDPSIFMSNMTEEIRVKRVWFLSQKNVKILNASVLKVQQESGTNMMKSAADAWSGQEISSNSLSRPNSLFSSDSYYRQDVKDLYLQDLSDSKSFWHSFFDTLHDILSFRWA